MEGISRGAVAMMPNPELSDLLKVGTTKEAKWTSASAATVVAAEATSSSLP